MLHYLLKLFHFIFQFGSVIYLKLIIVLSMRQESNVIFIQLDRKLSIFIEKIIFFSFFAVKTSITSQGAICTQVYFQNLYSSSPIIELISIALQVFLKIFIFIYSFDCTESQLQQWNLQLYHLASCSLAKDQTLAPALGAWSLSHWTTREVWLYKKS